MLNMEKKYKKSAYSEEYAPEPRKEKTGSI